MLLIADPRHFGTVLAYAAREGRLEALGAALADLAGDAPGARCVLTPAATLPGFEWVRFVAAGGGWRPVAHGALVFQRSATGVVPTTLVAGGPTRDPN